VIIRNPVMGLVGCCTAGLSVLSLAGFIGGALHPDPQVSFDAVYAIAVAKNFLARVGAGVEFASGQAPPEAYEDDRPITELARESVAAETGAIAEQIAKANERLEESRRTLEREGIRKLDSGDPPKSDGDEGDKPAPAAPPTENTTRGLPDVSCENDNFSRAVPRILSERVGDRDFSSLDELKGMLGSPACEVDGVGVWNVRGGGRLLAAQIDGKLQVTRRDGGGDGR